MTPPLDLQAIKELESKATPGPWEVFTIASPAGTSCRIFAQGLTRAVDICHIPMEWQGADNAAFIAASRSAVPMLVQEVERLREALTKAACMFEFYAGDHRLKASNARFNGTTASAEASIQKAQTNEEIARMCRAALGEGK